MIDPAEREIWRVAYLATALWASGRKRPTKAMERWAHAMSLIAEQHAPNDGDELVDAA